MNIDILKKRPQPKQKNEFVFLIDKPEQEKKMEIVDKRGSQTIDRSEILRRLQKNMRSTTIDENKEVVSRSDSTIIEEPTVDVDEDTSIIVDRTIDTVTDEPVTENPETIIEEAAIDVIDEVADKETDEIVDPEAQKKRGRKPKEGVFDVAVINKGVEELKKKLPKELGDQIIIRAPTYYMNNRKIFIKKINESFHGYLKKIQGTEKKKLDPNERTLFTHQEIVRDYLNIYTPYRGLLLFHGLGSGKTCSSIAIAEGMKTNKRIFLLTPASLKMNYFTELKKCGDDLYKKDQHWEFVSIAGKPENVEILSKTLSLSREYVRKRKGAWMVDVSKKHNYSLLTADNQKQIDDQLNEMIRVKYTDINYNGINMKKLKTITGDFTRNPFDNCVVIVDEAHNLVSRIVNKLKVKSSVSYKLYDYLMSAQNAKIVLLTGTPVINYPNEIAVLYNILRGYIKSWTFKLNVNTDDKTNSERILELFSKEGLNTYDHVEYSGNKLQVTRNPFGFINTNKRGVLQGKKRGGQDGGAEEFIEKGEVQSENMDEKDEPEVIDDSEEKQEVEEENKEENKEDDNESSVKNYSALELKDAQSNIATTQYDRINTLQQLVETMEDDMSKLKNKNSILEKQFLDGIVEEAKQTEVHEDKERLEAFEAKINALNESIENMKQDVKEPNDDDVEDTSEAADKMRKEFETDKDIFEARMLAQEEQFEKLNKTINELKGQNDDLQVQINGSKEESPSQYDMPQIINNQDQLSSKQEEMIKKQQDIIQDQEKNINNIQEQLAELNEKLEKLNSNDEVTKQQNALMKDQEKELKREIENMQKDKEKNANELDKLKTKKTPKGNKKGKKTTEESESDSDLENDDTEADQSIYGMFERNVNSFGKNVGNALGMSEKEKMAGGKTQKKKTASKRKTEKKQKSDIPIIEKLTYDEEDIEDDANVRNQYQIGYNQEYGVHSGGGPYFNKYNGVKLDDTGNISDEFFESAIVKILKKYKYDIQDKSIVVERFKCLPDDKEVFNDMFVASTDGSLMNSDVLIRRILGLTSYLSDKQELMPSIVKTNDGSKYHIIKRPMSDHQFSLYEKVRKSEADEEKRSRKNASKKSTDDDVYKFSSSYRVFSRTMCNFAFPPEIARPAPDRMSDEISEDAFDGIKKKEIVARDDYNPDDETEIKDDLSYQKKIVKAMKDIAKKDKSGVSTYLSKENLTILSPKLLSVLENIQHIDNVGSHLVYSQFRTIEGIGILKLILDANGYAEFKIKKATDGNWTITQKIGDEDKPKYVLYTGTETTEEKEIVRNIFNSDWSMVPASLVTQIEKRNKNNHYGEIIKVLMITASGAEGISLKNTRFVHVIEPYWHMVRTNQVVGRARRIGSHDSLPKKHQNVKVYLYLSTLSEEQKTSEKHIELRIRDVSRIDGNTPVTTDETLFEISSLKDKINQQILDAIKSSAFDCSLYATKQNDESVACYSFGNIKSNDFGSIPNIEIDKSDKKELNLKEVMWTAQKITFKGTHYALNFKTKEVFDFESYNAAKEDRGDLILVGTLTLKDGKPDITFN